MTEEHQTPEEREERDQRRIKLLESSGLSPEEVQKLAASAHKTWKEWEPQPGDSDRPLVVKNMPKRFDSFLEMVLEEYVRQKNGGPER